MATVKVKAQILDKMDDAINKAEDKWDSVGKEPINNDEDEIFRKLFLELPSKAGGSIKEKMLDLLGPAATKYYDKFLEYVKKSPEKAKELGNKALDAPNKLVDRLGDPNIQNDAFGEYKDTLDNAKKAGIFINRAAVLLGDLYNMQKALKDRGTVLSLLLKQAKEFADRNNGVFRVDADSAEVLDKINQARELLKEEIDAYKKKLDKGYDELLNMDLGHYEELKFKHVK